MLGGMTRIRLHDSSPEFSRLAFGTWRLLKDPATSTPEAVLALLKICLDVGITTIDTAEIYGEYRVEELIGQALKLDPGVAGRVEIITKAGIYVPNAFHPERKTAHYNATAARLVKSAEKSLRWLGVETLDLFLVHRPDWLASVDETAAGLNQLIKEGKIRSAGVSNHSVSQFRALGSRVEQPLVTNQVEFNPFHMAPIYDGVFDQCQELRVKPMAWSPMGGGRLFEDENPTAARLREAFGEMSGRYGGATADQLALAWIMAHPSQPMPALGTGKAERLRAAAAADGLKISREDWYAVWQAAHGHRIP
ncbi:MAG: ydhF [Verrucomicrobiales bacterium]|nr:ydhF [Verrucomicrobiales bacterium]